MNRYEFQTTLKDGTLVSIIYELDGYKPLGIGVYNEFGGWLYSDEYDEMEVYQTVIDHAQEQMIGNE